MRLIVEMHEKRIQGKTANQIIVERVEVRQFIERHPPMGVMLFSIQPFQ